MTETNTNWRSIAIKYGLILMGGLIGYFLLMLAFNLGHNYWLRVFNALILYFVIQAAIKKYKSVSKSNFYEDFIEFFRVGMSAGVIGILGFVVFIAIYLDLIDPAFMQEVKDMETLSPYLTPVTAAGIVLIEGVTSTFICSYLVIQFQKRSTVERPINPEDSEKKAERKARVDTRA